MLLAPRARAVTSGVTRARSSCVFNSAISVAWTISGSAARSLTPRPASVAAQSSVSATPGILRNSSLRRPATMRAICSANDASMPGWRGAQDRRLAVDVGKVEIMIEATPAQRVGEFARAVGGQHDARDRERLDGSELGDRHLEVGQQFEQERLEFLVGAVDFVDQQDRRVLRGGSRRAADARADSPPRRSAPRSLRGSRRILRAP